MASASLTDLPRMTAATSPALRGDPRTFFATARTSIPAICLPHRRRLLAAPRVPTEVPRGRELAQFVADHVFGAVDRHVAPAVVDADRVPHELGEDRAVPRPGLQDFFAAVHVEKLHLTQQLRIDVPALLCRSTHYFLPRRRTMYFVVALL